jgi:hypothetical protein
MRRACTLVIASAFCLAGCSLGESGRDDEGADGVQATQNASFSLLGTSWTYLGENDETVLETIDTSGNYISTVGTKVVDRGTVKMVDGQACFDSAQSKAPPNCWRVPEVAMGETKEYVDNHGQRLRVTRVAHVSR